ncbi:hypothetical protein INR49_016934 [Caranx melampygus]|nr:hypothetical protein INR49_016934 [Caranx melampygus]
MGHRSESTSARNFSPRLEAGFFTLGTATPCHVNKARVFAWSFNTTINKSSPECLPAGDKGDSLGPLCCAIPGGALLPSSSSPLHRHPEAVYYGKVLGSLPGLAEATDATTAASSTSRGRVVPGWALSGWMQTEARLKRKKMVKATMMKDSTEELGSNCSLKTSECLRGFGQPEERTIRQRADRRRAEEEEKKEVGEEEEEVVRTVE